MHRIIYHQFDGAPANKRGMWAIRHTDVHILAI